MFPVDRIGDNRGSIVVHVLGCIDSYCNGFCLFTLPFHQKYRVVTGDFKVHDELWYSLLVNDQRDTALAQQVYDSTFCSVGKGPDTIIVLA